MGLLDRDLSQFYTLAQSSLNVEMRNNRKFHKKIIYPTDWFPVADAISQKETGKSLRALEETLGVQRTELTLTELWSTQPPKKSDGKGLREYLNKTGYNLLYHDCYHEYEYFRADHIRKFQESVYVGPFIRYSWGRGAQSLQWNGMKQPKNCSISQVVFRERHEPRRYQ